MVLIELRFSKANLIFSAGNSEFWWNIDLLLAV